MTEEQARNVGHLLRRLYNTPVEVDKVDAQALNSLKELDLVYVDKNNRVRLNEMGFKTVEAIVKDGNKIGM